MLSWEFSQEMQYSPRSGDDPVLRVTGLDVPTYSPRSGDDPLTGDECHLPEWYSPRSGDDPREEVR